MIFLQTLAANAEPESTTKAQHFRNIKKIQFLTPEITFVTMESNAVLHKEAFSTQQNKFKGPLCLLMSCTLCIRAEKTIYVHTY